MDKIRRIFFQFDLYAGQKFGSGKHDFIPYLCVLRPSKPLKKKIKNEFWSFFNLFFLFDLYPSIYGIFFDINQSNLYKLVKVGNYRVADLHSLIHLDMAHAELNKHLHSSCLHCLHQSKIINTNQNNLFLNCNFECTIFFICFFLSV